MRKYILIFFFAGLIFNLILIDFWVIKESRTRVASQTSKVSEKKNSVNSQCDFSCPASCLSVINEATSSIKPEVVLTGRPQIVVTQIIAPTSIEKPIKEYFINFGGSVWTSSDWQSVPDLIKTVNLSQYGSIKKIYFEIVAHLSNENTSGMVRLHNNSDKNVVSGSEVSFNSTKCQPSISQSISLETYSKEYQIQVKTTEGATFFIDSARLRIVTQ